MELRHLRYFVAAAEEQNVTRAAARLHVSQPPLSRQIRDLESELGVALFERSAKSVRLTAAGRVFLDEARAVLRRTDEAVKAARAAAAGAGGKLRIGYAPSPTANLLPATLRAFQAHAPAVKVKLSDATSPQMLAGLRDGTLDLAMMTEPGKGAIRGLLFEPLTASPIMLGVAPSHPLARRRAVTIEEVVAQPIVAYARREYPDYHDFLARVLGRAVKRLRIVEECDDGLSLVLAVAANTGVVVTAAALAHVAGSRLRFVPIRPAPPPLVVGVARRPGTLTGAAQALVACARRAAKSEPAR